MRECMLYVSVCIIMIKWARKKDETCVTSAAFTDLSQTISRQENVQCESHRFGPLFFFPFFSLSLAGALSIHSHFLCVYMSNRMD